MGNNENKKMEQAGELAEKILTLLEKECQPRSIADLALSMVLAAMFSHLSPEAADRIIKAHGDFFRHTSQKMRAGRYCRN